MDITGSPAHGLDKSRIGPQEPFFVSIENSYQRNFRHIQSFAQQVDADQDIEHTGPQVPDDISPFDSGNIGVEITHKDPHFFQIVCQVLCHLFRQRRDQHPFMTVTAFAYFSQEIIHLPGNRADFYFRIEQPCRPDNLLGQIGLHFHFIIARCGTDKNNLIDPFGKFIERQRPVIQSRWQTESIFDKRLFA